jgi:hypothetical protein
MELPRSFSWRKRWLALGFLLCPLSRRGRMEASARLALYHRRWWCRRGRRPAQNARVNRTPLIEGA